MNMKYILIAFLLLAVGMMGGAGQVDAVVCQKGTAIVYGNGMFNSWDDSYKSKGWLEKKVHLHLQASPPTKFTVAELEFHLAYANDSGGFAAGTRTGLEQLLEVVKQKVAGSATDIMWQWLTYATKKLSQKLPPTAALAIDMIVPNSPPPWFRLAMKDIAAKANAAAYVNDVDLFNQINGDPLVLAPKMRFDGYKSLLNSGKRVVIVSHSQGAFYANRVYQVLTDPMTGNAAFAASISNVAVATPSVKVLGGKVALNEPYVTVPEDLVIAGVRALAPTLPAKGGLPISQNNFSQNFLDLGLVAWANASAGHNFVNWYLAGTYTRSFIMKGITDTLNGVNGASGLQYPTQVCTPPVAGPVATVPQPGPYYFRDDWGALTFDLNVLEFRGRFYRKDPWGRFKNLRDEQKGLAYHVDMSFTLTNPGTKTWGFPMKTAMVITDYTSMVQQTIPLTFTGQFYPQDVLLWSGGLVFLSFDHRTNNQFGVYHRDDIVRVNWRKVSIVDNGAGVMNRWVLKPVQSGTFSMPNYTATRKVWTNTPTGSAQKWGVGSDNQWNKLGVAFRDAMTYTYRIPFSAAEAHWTDAPSTPFGWVNGVNVPPPNPPLKNYLGEYGVLEVIDGVLSFTSLGKSPLQSTDVQQSGQVPQINTFGGIEQTIAYQASQGIVKKAVLVDEASQPNWRMAGTPPVAGAPALASLKATLPANGLFFNPRTWTQNFQYAYGTYGQIFIPFSLSKQMAASLAIGINNTPKFSQQTAIYKLGTGFSFSYPAPPPAGVPRFFRRGVHNCLATVPGCTFGRIYGVSVNATQKAFMMSPVP